MRLELGDLLESLIATGELEEADAIISAWQGLPRHTRPGLGARDPARAHEGCSSPPGVS